MAAKRIDDLLGLFWFLALRHRMTSPGALRTQGFCSGLAPLHTDHREALPGSVTLDNRLLCGADGEITAPNHVTQIDRIVGQYFPINLPRIIDAGPPFRNGTTSRRPATDHSAP